MNVAEAQDLIVRLRLDGTQWKSAIAGIQRDLARLQTAGAGAGAGFAASLSKITSGIGTLARGVIKVAERGLLALGAAMVYATIQSSNFEDAFAGVARTLSDNAAELAAAGGLEKIRTGLLELSRILPVTQTQLAGIAEVAGTAGIAAGDIVKFTEAIARLSKISDLNIETITPAIAKLLLVLKVGSGELNNFFSGLEQASIIGPSTDQEILLATERFASLGTQIGFTRDQLLALATISTSFGQRPEAAGTSVLLVMQRLSRTLVEGGKGLKLLAEVSGKSAKEIRAEWQDNPYQGLIDFLTGLQKLSPGQQAVVLKGLGLSTARIGQLLANLSANIPTLQKYTDAVTAADEEGTLFLELSDKRFTTTKNHLITLMNNVRDLGIAFGEGLGIDKATGALDRFISRLIDLLQKHRGDIVKFGEDFGKFLDNIDLDKVASGFGVVISLAKQLIDQLSRVPPEFLALLAGLVGINKLSSGLIGQGVGGIASGIGGVIAKTLGNLFANIPILGKAFVQPVFVTNPGFGAGGGLGAAGAVATLAGAIAVAIPIALASKAATDAINAGLSEPANSAQAGLKPPNFANPFTLTGSVENFAKTVDLWAQYINNRLRGTFQHQDPGFGHGSDVGGPSAQDAHIAAMYEAGMRDDLTSTQLLLDAANDFRSATDKFVEGLKPIHRAGEKGRSLQSAEFGLINRTGNIDKVNSALADLIGHYTKEPIGSKNHPASFIIPAFKGIFPELKRDLIAAMKSGGPGLDKLLDNLRGLKTLGIHLPAGLRHLIAKAEASRKTQEATEKATRETKAAVKSGLERNVDKLQDLRMTLAHKKLSTTVKPSWTANVRAPSVHVTPIVRVTVGARTITRYIRGTVAYGPGLVLMQTGSGGAAVYSGGGGP